MDVLHSWIIPPGITVSPAVYVGVAVIALLLTAVSKGGFGGGVGILSTPLMIQIAPEAKFAIGLWLPILIVSDMATIHHYPREWNPKAFWRLTPGMLLGITIATVFLSGSTGAAGTALDTFLKLSVAAISLVFLALQFRKPVDDATATPWHPTWRVSLPVGLVAGITTMIAHAAGPVITMFLLPQKMEKRVFMGTCGRFFFIFNKLKITFAIVAGVMTFPSLRYGLWLMALAPLGVALGAYLNKRVSSVWFVRLVQFSLVIAAGKLVFDAVKMLGAK